MAQIIPPDVLVVEVKLGVHNTKLAGFDGKQLMGLVGTDDQTGVFGQEDLLVVQREQSLADRQ